MQDGIFVSYSHSDNQVVEQLVAILKEVTGKNVWFDHNLRGGENYFSVIANQIIDNKYFVFVVSNNSIESDWCLRELEFAASEKRKIIAIWLDNIDISPRIKLIIQNTQYINWYSGTNDHFSQSVSLAFEENTEILPTKDLSRDDNDISTQQQKYFLDKDDLKNISSLLRAEESEQFSICFIPENANLLGIAYELGVSVEADEKKAALYYKASKYLGNLDGQYLYAALMYEKDIAKLKHLSEMLNAAEQGGILALTYMGDCYYEGKLGLPVDKEKAYKYYERAAKAGGTIAMYYTAYGYRHGEVLPKDVELAYMFALKAKEKKYAKAYRLLGFMYRDGEYVDADPKTALCFFDEAIKLGDAISYCHKGYTLGKLGEEDKQLELYKKAVSLADEGIIVSGTPYFRLALLYHNGSCVDQDFETATKYYLKAAERGHADAKEWAVSCILQLSGAVRTSYLKKAYSLECSQAAYELGQLEKAKRTNDEEKISEVAIGYFETGAEQGDIRCVLELLWNYSFVIGNGKNRDDRLNAIKWFRFFFANADEEFLKHCSDANILATYYYAYAIELDYDPDINKPDREFVLYNFKKSISECPRHLENIVGFAVNGYLFPDQSDSGLSVDVPHAEDLLCIVQGNLEAYYDYVKTTTPDYYQSTRKAVENDLKKGYSFISKCYLKGEYVAKDKEKARKYKQLSLQL